MLSRIELLRSFISQRPNDPFPKYALALEHKNSGRMQEAADAFATLMSAHPDYVPAYLHAGNTLVALGKGMGKSSYGEYLLRIANEDR